MISEGWMSIWKNSKKISNQQLISLSIEVWLKLLGRIIIEYELMFQLITVVRYRH
jgi:hypothetical protein